LLAEGATEPSVLYVSFTKQARACIDKWEASDGQARNLGVITVGDASTATDREDVRTESISAPSDLTGLGIQIGQFLSGWDAPVAICFDSLTSMLQYVDFQTAYEFLHAITGQVHAAGARAHFHVDPSAHADTEIAGITALFDARVSLSGEEPDVRTREVMQ
jgi:hypothetical protein